MELQVALDRIPLPTAVELTTAIASLVDWIEVGTSMVKQYGRNGLEAVVEAAGGTPVLADLKTVDDVRFELALAYDAGAGSATVLGLSPSATIDAAVAFAAERGRELVVDLMGLSQAQIGALVERLPHQVVLSPHISKDVQASGARAAELLGPWSAGRRIALAGGLTAADLPALRTHTDLRVIVGSAVTAAADPLKAVLELRSAAGMDDER
jgi:3-hexulose-6-phosphate synthase